MQNRIMAHMVAFYPDRESSIEIARALIQGGCSYLEVQFPFSDPTADGTYIQKACDKALQNGFKISGGFELLRNIRKFSNIPIFIMGYANTVFSQGIGVFLKKCTSSGVHGLIIPDLPPDYDEGIFHLGEEMNLIVMPVIAPTIKDTRLQLILSYKSKYVYATLRKGITGAYTKIGESNIAFLKKLESKRVNIFAGFGISSRKQATILAPYVHASVVGSAFIKEIGEKWGESSYDVIYQKMKSLL